MKKIAIIGLLGLAGVLALLLVASLAVVTALYSEWGRDWALEQARGALKAETGITLEYEGVQGRLPVRLTLSGVKVSQKGRVFFSARKLTLAPKLAALLAGRAGLGLLRLDAPHLALPFPEFASGDSGGGALPLVFFIRRLEIINANIDPNREWGPVERLSAVSLAGRLRLSNSGFRFAAESLSGKAKLDGMPEPVRLDGKARLTSLDNLVLDDVALELGGNRARLKGSLNWKDDLTFKADLRGGFSDPAALPMAWPGPHPPKGEIGFALAASGKITECEFNGLLTLQDQKLGLAGSLNLATLAGGLELLPKGFNPATWGLAGQSLILSGKLSAKTPGPALAPDARVDLGLELSQLSLPDVLQAGVKARAVWHENRLELETLEAEGGWGEIRAKGHYALALKSRPESLNAEVAFSRLSAPPALAKLLPENLRRPDLNGTITAGGRPADLQVNLALNKSEITPGLTLDALSAKAALKEFKPVLQSLDLSLAGTRLQAEGRADPAGADLAFHLDAPELAPLASALAGFAPGLKSLAGDNLVAKGQITGAWSGPGLQLTLTADRAGFAGNSLESLRIKADIQNLGAKPAGKVNLAVESLSAGGMQLESLTALAGLSPKGLDLEASTTGMGWKAQVELSALGSGAEDLAATVRRLSLTPPGKKPWVLAKPAQIKLDRKVMSLQNLTLQNAGQSIAMRGSLIKASGEVDCTLTIDGFKPGPWLGKQNVFPGAYLNFSAGLSGKLSDPVIGMKGRFSGLAMPKLPVLSLSFKGDYAKNKLVMNGLVATAGRPFFHLRAALDMGLSLSPAKFTPDPAGMVDITLRGRDLPINLFQPLLTGISQLNGKLGAHLTAKGPWKNVELSGSAALAGGGGLVDATGQLFKNLNAKFNLDGRKISVEYCSLRSKGEMKLTGSALLPGRGQDGYFNFRLASKKFMVLLGNYGEADLETDIALTGDFQHPVLKGTIRPESVRLAIMERPSDDLDDVVILHPGQKPPPIRQEKSLGEFNPTGFLGSVLIDLQLDISRRLKISAKQGWLDISGGASVYKEPFKPMRFRDEIILEQGLIMMSGKRLKINSGSVDFEDKTIPDPSLNLEATYSANAATIFITIAGTASSPNLQLTSQPPMSRTDILSTIIFGKPANSLSADQNNRFQGAALALLGQQGVNIMRKFVGDTLTPDVVTVHNQDSGSSALEAGKYLSPDLYLRYRQDLGEDGGRNVGLEYRLKPWLSLESQVGTTRDTGVDVIFNFDF